MCSKLKHLILYFLLLAGFGNPVLATNLTAVYSSACEREIGVILKTDENKVKLLTLKGSIIEISPYEIIYLAYYPIDRIPIQKVTVPAGTQAVNIRTLHENNLVDLVRGWPVDFSDKEISIFTLNGDETIIHRDSIWDFEYVDLPPELQFKMAPSFRFRFVHPYPFENCKIKDEVGPESALVRTVNPIHLVGDPFLIKKELDRLKEGYDQISDYYKDKRFYPVPQVYKNKSWLGMWLSLGSRYGSSHFRSNNFNPLFVSELSEGPFGFQRILITGNAPMLYSVHEEPQSQFYYRLKADYVHFSFMYDYNRFLIGEEKYKWQSDGLKNVDSRINELQHIGGGFDYGSHTLDFSLTSVQYALQAADFFFTNRVDLNKMGYFYQTRNYKLEIYLGNATDAKSEDIFFTDDDTPEIRAMKERLLRELEAKPDYLTLLTLARINFLWPDSRIFQPKYSLIYRVIDYKQNENDRGAISFNFLSKSVTNALYFSFQYDDNITMSGFVSMEAIQSNYGFHQKINSHNLYSLKTGGLLSLLF